MGQQTKTPRKEYCASTACYLLTWAVIHAAIFSLSFLLLLYDAPFPENKLTLSDFRYIESSAKTPADIKFSANGPVVKLPDTWEKRNLKTNSVWYKTTVSLNVPPNRLWAALIPGVKMNAAFYLNGELLGVGGRFADPVARNLMTPLFFTIPNGLMKPGNNTVHIRVKSDPPGAGHLSHVYLGPHNSLLRAYNKQYFFRITIIKIVATMLLAMGLIVFMLWYVRRSETYYGYFALAIIMWGLHTSNIFIVNIPVNTRLWDWLIAVTFGYFSILSILYIHRFLSIRRQMVERVGLSIGVVGSVILLLVEDKVFYFSEVYIWYPIIGLIGLYILVTTGMAACKQRSTELQLLTASIATLLLYSFYDLLVLQGHITWENGRFSQYAAIFSLTMANFVLLRRFIRSLNKVDSLNSDLEMRIEQKRAQLAENYKKLNQFENERVLTEERDRLTRDMHDGMGGHLVSTLAMIDSGRASIVDVKDAIIMSLNDLKMMIDSMDIGDSDLSSLLEVFKERIEPRLMKIENFSLEWSVGDLPPIPGFGPREALNILRILQEAITNIIKHAEATSITFTAKVSSVDEQAISIDLEVRDNGKGIREEDPAGYGLKNMRRRAKDIGASFSVGSTPSGTNIFLKIPTEPQLPT